MHPETIATIVAASSPLVFAVLGETLTEKVGVVNLSLDGSMLLAAMVGFAIAFTTGSVELGFLAAAIVSSLVALIIVFTSIELRLIQIAIGLILTLLGTKLAAFLGQDFVRQVGPSVQARAIPYLEDIPYLGKIFFDHNPVVYASFFSYCFGIYLFVSHPPWSRITIIWRTSRSSIR